MNQKVRTVIDYLSEHYNAIDMQITPPRSGTAGYVGIEVNLLPSAKAPYTPASVSKDLEALEDVVFALESI